MRIYVYEYITALGIGREPGSPEHSLYREGRAMRDAVTEDLARIPGVEVIPFQNETDWVREAVSRSDWQLVIAPEFDGILTTLTQQIEAQGGRILGPASEAVALTSDKLRLAEHWREHGIPTPATSGREPSVCEIFPLVWKPRDGAGSTATFRLDRSTDVARCQAVREAEGHAGEMLMQEYVPGRPASVAFLTGPGVAVPLPPTEQRLSNEGRFRYEGGSLPLPANVAERAVRLGKRALACVPGLRGWVGVDLVLGDEPTGERDYAIEINPRLTTSYVGVRALLDGNLAEAMLRAAEGEAVVPNARLGRVSFTPDGAVRTYPE